MSMMRRSVDLENWQKLPEATLLTIGEVAEILRVSPNQIRNAIRAGLLRAGQSTSDQRDQRT